MKNYMKKFATILTTLTLVVVLGVCLSACGNSNKGMSKADYQANLEKADYSINIGNSESRTIKLVDYSASLEEQKNAESVTAEWMISANKEVKVEVEGEEEATTKHYSVTIVEFANAADADKVEAYYTNMMNKQFETMDQYYEANKDTMTEEEIKAYQEQKDAYTLVRDGNVCFMGNKVSIETAQGK